MDIRDAVNYLAMQTADKPLGWQGNFTCPICESITECHNRLDGSVYVKCKTSGCIAMSRKAFPSAAQAKKIVREYEDGFKEIFKHGQSSIAYNESEDCFRTTGSTRDLACQAALQLSKARHILEAIENTCSGYARELAKGFRDHIGFYHTDE